MIVIVRGGAVAAGGVEGPWLPCCPSFVLCPRAPLHHFDVRSLRQRRRLWRRRRLRGGSARGWREGGAGCNKNEISHAGGLIERWS